MTKLVGRKCLACRAILPTDADKADTTVTCSFCKSPNPNPEIVKDDKPAKYHESRRRTQTIELQESAVNLLLYILGIAFGIAVITLFATGSRFPRIYLMISSVIVFLPVISIYFVPAHWEKVCKWASSETGDTYRVSYTRYDIGWINYSVSYILQAWFLGVLLNNLFEPRNGDAVFGTWTMAVFAAGGTLYILHLTTQAVGRILGLIISRPK